MGSYLQILNQYLQLLNTLFFFSRREKTSLHNIKKFCFWEDGK